MNGKKWVITSIGVHALLLAMAGASLYLSVQLNHFTQTLLFVLAAWLVYLLFTKGPVVKREEVPSILRIYLWVMAGSMLVLFHVLTSRGFNLPLVPVRLFFLAVLVPFAMLLRLKYR